VITDQKISKQIKNLSQLLTVPLSVMPRLPAPISELSKLFKPACKYTHAYSYIRKLTRHCFTLIPLSEFAHVNMHSLTVKFYMKNGLADHRVYCLKVGQTDEDCDGQMTILSPTPSLSSSSPLAIEARGITQQTASRLTY